jgi:NAD(P)-dependent dehydrogenase (short-subunit alcohol dehydrogenase family)
MARKTIIVTGAASGIGQAAARLLLARGDNVCAADIAPIGADDFGPDNAPRLLPSRVDVAEAASCAACVEAAVARFGRIDGLIHMAGVHSSRTWREIDAAETNHVLAVNTTGAMLMAQACARAMEASGGGAIVFATSGVINVSGTGGDGRGGPAYAASKGAIIGVTRALARSLAPIKVRVNAVSPGSTRTPMTATYTEEALRRVGEKTLIGRVAEAHEIASVAVFLVSDESAYIWGEIVNVNGGAHFGG